MQRRDGDKIVIVGETATGKTALVTRLTEDRFIADHNNTIGASFIKYTMKLDDGTEKNLQLWDMTGDNRQRSLTRMHYVHAVGILITFDVSNRESFENLQQWVDRVKDFKEDCANVLLVGTKIDEERKDVTEEEAREYAENVGFPLIFTSSLEGTNVREAFLQVLQNREQPEEQEEQEEEGIKGNNKQKKNSPLLIVGVVALILIVCLGIFIVTKN